MPGSRRLGSDAEDRAADYLLAKGFTIVTRRFKGGGGEIDLVALDGDLLVFVEVKSSSLPLSRPEDALDVRKARCLAPAAESYLAKVGELRRPFRFDLVAITPEGVRHYEDAFRGPRERGGRPRREE